MIVDESDALLAALDRRLSVDRLPAIDAKLPGRDATAASDGRASVGDPSARPVAPAALPAADDRSALETSLPRGRIVSARIVDVGSGDDVVAEIDRWHVTLSLPDGADPKPGDRIALRVIAHEPTLLLQAVDADGLGASTDATDDLPTRWSPDAMRLARDVVAGDPRAIRRFTGPIVDVATASVDETRPGDPAAPASPAAPLTLVDAPTLVRDARPADPASSPVPMTAMVLQGPAWPGQPIEIVVRRERADEAFDNAQLDRWCGEIVIDLPHLGRVVGHLAWSMQGLRIRLDGEDDASASSMRVAAPELAAALADAALPVVALSVGRPLPDTGSPRRG